MTGIYFSGTGNTRFCLSQFLSKISNNHIMYSIEDNRSVSAILESKDILFAYPIYYSNLPKIVRDFIERNNTLWNGKNIYIIATMGLFSGDGAGVSARIFKRYHANIVGGLHLRMPDCIGDVKSLKKPFEENRKIIQATGDKIDHAANLFLNNKPTQDGLNPILSSCRFIWSTVVFQRKDENVYEKSQN